MYKEDLPNDCPPKSAIEIEMKLYRILKTSNISEDEFIPYARLYPNNPRNKKCKSYAISFYLSKDSALIEYKKAKKRNRILGNYIAEIEIKKDYGKSEITNKTGHVSFWFYKKCNFDQIVLSKINKLNGN